MSSPALSTQLKAAWEALNIIEGRDYKMVASREKGLFVSFYTEATKHALQATGGNLEQMVELLTDVIGLPLTVSNIHLNLQMDITPEVTA